MATSHLSNETTREKVDAWLQRAGGIFFDFHTLPGLFGSASARIWSSLEHLEIRSDVARDTLLPPTAYKELRLRSLNLTIYCPSHKFWDDLWTVDVSRMRDLQLNADFVAIPIAGSRFTGLATLRLSGSFEESALLAVLERNPMLETLDLFGIIRQETGVRREAKSTRRAELVKLTQLAISLQDGSADVVFQYLVFPGLKTLNLDVCEFRSHEALLANIFRLRHPGILSSVLITILRIARSLRKLVFMEDNELNGNVTDSVLEALASPIPGDLEGTPPTLCCPRLQYLHLIVYPELTTVLVMGIVKARLPCIGSATGLVEKSAVQPLPIVYLEIEDCPSVDRGSLHWFEANVPEFICR